MTRNKLKQITAAAMVLTMAAGMCACGKVNTLAEIKKRGKLYVAVEDNCFPNAYRDEAGEYAGIDVDIITEVAEDLGLPLEFVDDPNKDAVKLLRENRADIAISGLPIDEAKKKEFLCSMPYDSAAMFAVSKRGLSFATLGTLSGQKVGYTGEFSSNFAAAVGRLTTKNNKPTKYDAIDNVATDIAAGTIDVFLCYEHQAIELARNNLNLQAETITNLPKENYVMMMFKTARQLQEKVNAVISDMTSSGGIDALRIKYADETLYEKYAATAQN
jgi:polar amino acid transport system substrate-binding protein